MGTRELTRSIILAASVGLFGFMAAAPAMAGGPLAIYNPNTRTPYAYAPGVNVYTDLGALGILSNATADGLTSTAFAEWTNVATATFSAAVAGDFTAVGLPDITGANAGLVVGPNNGGGIHVMYDDNGTIISNFFGAPPGVLGIASPEWVLGSTITESWAVMNGTAIDPADGTGAFFRGVFTHEFGHSINMAHSQTNGQSIFFGDPRGPDGCARPYGGGPNFSHAETMYPFIDPSFGSIGAQMATVNLLDDIATLSDIYPAADWPDSGGVTIEGVVYWQDGSTELTGINVIARNVANPFADCQSALSGDFTQGANGPDGLYTFTGLTPGADYIVYIDDIVAGGFSTPPIGLPPTYEEYWNSSESADPLVDDRCAWTFINDVNGATVNADIIVNEGAVPVNDDGFIEVPLPWPFEFCDVVETSVFINANGSVTFGSGDTDFSPTVSEFLNGPPRIAALWTDLSPQEGNGITFQEVGGDEFHIIWNQVPAFGTSQNNTFRIILRSDGSHDIQYTAVQATANAPEEDVLVGRGGGGAPNPGESDMITEPEPITDPHIYELFTGGVDDPDELQGETLEFAVCGNPCLVNIPPTAVCQSLVFNLADTCTSVVVDPDTLDNGSSDPDGTIISFVLEPAGPFGEGITAVDLIVTDDCGASDTCSATIEVICPDPPDPPVLEADPKSVLFGTPAFGDTVCAEILIWNSGGEPLSLNLEGDCAIGNFFIDSTGMVNPVPPGDSTSVLVCYSANEAGPDSCTLQIQSNGGDCDVEVLAGATTAVDNPTGLPARLLVRAMPNPFRAATEVRFDLPRQAPVRVEVFDLSGRRVAVLTEGTRNAGPHSVRWNGRNTAGTPTAGGIYFIRVVTPTETQVVRAVRVP